MPLLFHVRARLATRAGGPATGVLVVLQDVDDYLDDTIAVGFPDQDGVVACTFTREAFNQDLLENEATPDQLRLLFYSPRDGVWAEFFRSDHAAPAFDGNAADLGSIELPLDAPIPLDELVPDPSQVVTQFAGGPRLDLTDEAMAAALDRVAPAVESLTGWANLRSGVSFRVTDSIALEVGEMARRHASGAAVGLFDRLGELLSQGFGQGFAAVFDPFDRVVWCDRHFCGTLGFDGFCVLLGHELVHVGQFREFPGLVGEYRQALVALDDEVKRKKAGSPASPEHLARFARAFAFMASIEGFAKLIEDGFLRREIRFSIPVPHVSPLLMLLSLPVGLFSLLLQRSAEPQPTPEPQTPELRAALALARLPDIDMKAAQYLWGQRFYRERFERERSPSYRAGDLDEILSQLPAMVEKYIKT